MLTDILLRTFISYKYGFGQSGAMLYREAEHHFGPTNKRLQVHAAAIGLHA